MKYNNQDIQLEQVWEILGGIGRSQTIYIVKVYGLK